MFFPKICAVPDANAEWLRWQSCCVNHDFLWKQSKHTVLIFLVIHTTEHTISRDNRIRLFASFRMFIHFSFSTYQWRTQKILMVGVSFSGIWCLFVFGVRYLWRHNLKSYPCFQTNVLVKFVDTIRIFFHTHSPYFMCYCNQYKLSALQVRISEENTLNATTQQFITAKISGWALK